MSVKFDPFEFLAKAVGFRRLFLNFARIDWIFVVFFSSSVKAGAYTPTSRIASEWK